MPSERPRPPRDRRDDRGGRPPRDGGRGRPREQHGRDRRDRAARKSDTPPQWEPVHLSDAVVKELHELARPGKGEILVKVFADAAAAFAAGDLESAINLADQSKHIALRSPTVRELLGLAYYRAGQYKEAARELSAFRRISGSGEQNPVLADSYRALGRPERALELLDEMREESVSTEVWYEGAIVAAGALGDAGRVDEAIARLEALDLRPPVAQEHHVRTWYVLASLLERRGRFSQAKEWFEAVSAADPELTDASERIKRLI